MSDPTQSGVPFTGDNSDEQRLWEELEALPQPAPSPRLRQRFYGKLAQTQRLAWVQRFYQWWALKGTPVLLTAAGCFIVGLMSGQFLGNASSIDQTEFFALQNQVATLHRDLILDRLESDSPNKRLLGVMDAGRWADGDDDVARALLVRATQDRVPSIRSAAILALGSQLSSPAVGDELMRLVETAESPLVQLAVVDLVLRHGKVEQLERLLELTEQGAFSPDVAQHVITSIRRTRA